MGAAGACYREIKKRFMAKSLRYFDMRCYPCGLLFYMGLT